MKSLHWGLDEILDRILALLDVSGGARLLDLCCGHGRHAEELASRGLWVTALPVAEAAVDGAYCWFSSIVYGEAESDRRLLREAWRALRPGARLVVESSNAFVGRRPGEDP